MQKVNKKKFIRYQEGAEIYSLRTQVGRCGFGESCNRYQP